MSMLKLRNEILPNIFNKRGFELVDCVFDVTSEGQDQLQSNVVFLTAVVMKKKETVKFPLIVKCEPFNPEYKKIFRSSIQFYNEVLMYNKILPLLNKVNICEETYPKFYYGVGETRENENLIIVFEDLRPLGYELTKERAFLDFDHLSLSVAKLGRFHALSFAAKKECPEEFFKLSKNLKETLGRDKSIYRKVIQQCFHRPVKYLMDKHKHVELLQVLLDCIDYSAVDFMMKLLAPTEPIAAICHGDFCRNNMLYKYSDNGRPVDVKFFDLATSRYSSPMTDLSFFLLLNSAKVTREDHWDELLAVYHRALFTAIPSVEVPTLQDIREEMKRKAMYGFVHCSFFLPQVAFNSSFNQTDLLSNACEELISEHWFGGEECTKMLADMLEELIEKGCLTLEHDFMSIQ